MSDATSFRPCDLYEYICLQKSKTIYVKSIFAEISNLFICSKFKKEKLNQMFTDFHS